VPKTITATGVNDGVADAPQAYTIITSDAASSDPNYSGRAVLDVPIKNYIDFPPTIAASAQSLIAGLPRSGITLATVGDIEDSPASLSVSATSVHSDLALGPLVNTGGVITADLSASCGAASATRAITLQVTDSVGNVRTTNVPITVTANQAPSIGWYAFPGPTIAQGGGTVLAPNFAPDPTFLDTFTVTPVAGYAGSATLDRATGNITLANAAPRGINYFVVRATSFCGSTTSYYAYAVVENNAPTLGSYANATVPAGAGTTVAASGGPGDDGSIAGMSVSAPGFTGSLSVDPSTGNVTVANADPPGSFVVQVKATDNLGVTGSASFTLTVDPPSPLPACTAALYTVLNDEPARLATVDGSGTVTAGPALSGLAFNSALPVLAMDFSPGGALYAIVAKSDASLAWARIDPDSGAVTELGPFASMPGDFTLGRSPTGPVRGYMTELSPLVCSPPCSSAQVDSVRSIESLNPLATSFHRLTNSGSAASWPPLLSAPRGLPALALSRDEQTLFALGTTLPDVAYAYDVANPREFTNSGFSIAGYTTGSLRTTMDAQPDADLFSFFHGSVGVTADPLSGNTASALSQAVRGVAAWRRCANAPVIDIATPPSLERGAAASAKSVGAVRDSSDAAGSIVMSAPVVPSGVTIAAPANSGGAVTAPMSAACSAPLGRSYATFRATDSSGLFADEALPIDVTANQPPVVGYAAARVRLGAGRSVTPSTALADAGSIASVTATSPTFTGTLTGSAANGAITVAAAAPAGSHTVTVVATDNCGATTSTTFTLTVDAPPSIAPSSPSVQAGSAATSVPLATIADAEDAAGTLTVAATSVPAGVTLGAITNTNGALTAPLSASCSVTPGTHAIG
ncbi:MAG TPA: hypothetical protein VLV48_07995, partial [Thermoanaerobaculia bacterium]|nr:hypothetical protein [Thermoanaerobaculia bacterium]